MKKIFVALVFVLTPLTAFAAEATVSVNVPDHCTVADTQQVSHNYSGQYLGICALQAAIDAGSVTGVEFSNAFPSFGLFVTSVGGVAADPNSQYWALYRNAAFADVGLTQLPVAAGDTLMLELHDYSDNYLGSRLTLTIASLASSAPTPVARGSGVNIHAPFDVDKALTFLWNAQHADGSFGSPLLDDWVAIGSAVGGFGDMRAKLAAYEKTHPIVTTVATENERRAMALQALGIDPRTGSPVDYIDAIVKSFDGRQIGDPHLDNDDIFAIFPLMKAGYTASDDIIQKTIAFILSAQQENGSWDSSADMTAAAVQALTMSGGESAQPAIKKALGYLHGVQRDDGSFGNSFTTSWVLQAIAATDGSVADWYRGSNTLDYSLAVQQDRDGGMGTSTEMDSRIWATSYAIPAVKRMTWDQLLTAFPRATSTPGSATTEALPAIDATSTTATQVPVQITEQLPPAPLDESAPVGEINGPVLPTPDATAKEPAERFPAQSESQAGAAAAAAVPTFWSSVISFLLRLF